MKEQYTGLLERLKSLQADCRDAFAREDEARGVVERLENDMAKLRSEKQGLENHILQLNREKEKSASTHQDRHGQLSEEFMQVSRCSLCVCVCVCVLDFSLRSHFCVCVCCNSFKTLFKTRLPSSRS